MYGIDYEGHGRSAGARCYIRKFDGLVADCDRFFKSVCGQCVPNAPIPIPLSLSLPIELSLMWPVRGTRAAEEQHREKRRFLYGESMGGAVALLLHRRDPSFWDGAVLVAPMCKVHH